MRGRVDEAEESVLQQKFYPLRDVWNDEEIIVAH
jgi:hypothetical protein